MTNNVTSSMTKADYLIIFDGGSKGNPGRGYGSYAIQTTGSPPRIVSLDFPGRVTNNEAEYDTLIAALESLADVVRRQGGDPATRQIEVRGDSLLVIEQVTGRWKASEPRMRERRDRVRVLAGRFKRVSYVHHPRSESVKVLGH
jgi:ribonuclease HI